MRNLQKKFQKGFTLVETLVAIAILSLAITGPMVIAEKGIGSAIYARDEVTAFYLAEEAVEYVRNVRDTNRIAAYAGGWLSQFSTAGCLDTSGQKCQINATINPPLQGHSNAGITACSGPGNTCQPIDIETLTGNAYLYGYGSGLSWTPTQFTRTVDIKEINPGVEAVITVTISWQTNIFTPPESFTVAEHIFAF